VNDFNETGFDEIVREAVNRVVLSQRIEVLESPRILGMLAVSSFPAWMIQTAASSEYAPMLFRSVWIFSSTSVLLASALDPRNRSIE
jgi:hypothetical protein